MRLRTHLIQTWWSFSTLARSLVRPFRRQDLVARELGLRVAVRRGASSLEAQLDDACRKADVWGRAQLCASLAERCRSLFRRVCEHPSPFGRGRCDPTGIVERQLELLWDVSIHQKMNLTNGDLANLDRELMNDLDLTAGRRCAVVPGDAWIIVECLRRGWFSLWYPTDFRPAVDAVHRMIDFVDDFEVDDDAPDPLASDTRRQQLELDYLTACLAELSGSRLAPEIIQAHGQTLRRFAIEMPSMLRRS